MRPFLRWAGGKRWLASSGNIQIPRDRRYVEPFLGGGAIFFYHKPKRSLLSDINPYLVNAYISMRDYPREVYDALQEHFNHHSNTYYYKIRNRLAYETVLDAADFIYLNRACFNGLFRVSLKGKFNVPIGTKLYPLLEYREFDAWASALKNADIMLKDFEGVVDECSSEDFLFLDPPYTVNHNSNGFIEYNEKIFGWSDQVRLHNCLTKAHGRGAQFILTNADHSTVRALYSGFTPRSIARGSEMAGKTAFRRRTTELLISTLSPAQIGMPNSLPKT